MNKTPAMSQTARDKATQQLKLHAESDHFHPLEAIQYFRRWPRSFLRNLIYTLIFNLLFAIGFTLLTYVFVNKIGLAQFPEIFLEKIVIANVVGFAFWIVFSALGPLMRRINGRSFWFITLSYAIIGTAIVTCSMWGFAFFTDRSDMLRWIGSREQVFTSFVISLVISLVLATVWTRRAEELLAQVRLAEERERTEAAERTAVQANLRALQAQIEPHFLFNTLANVTSLIHTQPNDAKRMLEEFITYLRTTLASTRESRTTLAGEFELMKSFLAVLQIRMGDRLRVVIDLPEDLRQATIPPMLLQPLIENAIKHGLEPKVEGGSVNLKAEHSDGQLRISVIDTGLGFGEAPSNGIGLRNVRERIEKLFGNDGSVTIEENQPGGTRVLVCIPLTVNS